MTKPWPGRAAILLDLDGTLIDTAPDLAGTLNEIMVDKGLATFALEEVRHLVGHGAKVLLQRGLAFHGQNVSEAELSALVDEFVERYSARIARESAPFEGATAALDQLVTHGARLGIVTNKRESLARLLLDQIGLLTRFDAIFGGDTLPRRKPHADPLLGALATLGVQPDYAVMVGDTDTDVSAARAAGIPVIAVTFGYSEKPAHSLGADAIIAHFDELSRTAARLLGFAT